MCAIQLLSWFISQPHIDCSLHPHKAMPAHVTALSLVLSVMLLLVSTPSCQRTLVTRSPSQKQALCVLTPSILTEALCCWSSGLQTLRCQGHAPAALAQNCSFDRLRRSSTTKIASIIHSDDLSMQNAAASGKKMRCNRITEQSRKNEHQLRTSCKVWVYVGSV